MACGQICKCFQRVGVQNGVSGTGFARDFHLRVLFGLGLLCGHGSEYLAIGKDYQGHNRIIIDTFK